MALDGTKQLSENNEKMRADLEGLAAELKSQIDSTKASSAVQIEAVKNEASAWAEQFKSNLYAIMEAGNSLGKTGGKRMKRSTKTPCRRPERSCSLETTSWRVEA